MDEASKEQPNLKVYRFTHIVFGVSASPFLLNATIRLHLERHLDTNKTVVDRLLHSTYVDDIISGANTEEEAFNLYTIAKAIFLKGGFNLRKFLTNSRSLQERINQQENLNDESAMLGEPTYSEITLGTSQPLRHEEHKVLGVLRSPESDQFIFDVSIHARLACDLQPTKRNLVSLIGKFYDPLGFLFPVVIWFKLLLQELYQLKLDWDQAISDEVGKKWKDLIADISGSAPMSLPRCYFGGNRPTEISYTLWI